MDSIAGRFSIDWKNEGLERVNDTIIKKYNAEIHSQSAIKAMIELKNEHGIDPDLVDQIDIDIFDVAYHIIGGGEEGDKTVVRTKEEADHSLQYMIAAALLDGTVMPEQYRPDRIESEDIQSLLQKVTVTPNAEYSKRFPDEMPVKLTVQVENGESLGIEKKDYEGFHTHPMSWETVRKKFDKLAAPYTNTSLRDKIVYTIKEFEHYTVPDLMKL